MRTVLASIISVFWLAAVAFYVWRFVGWDNLLLLMPNELSSFVVGIAAPLVVVWLAALQFGRGSGARLSTELLAQHAEGIARAAELAERQAEWAAASASSAQRDAVLRLGGLLSEELRRLVRQIVEVLPDKNRAREAASRYEAGNGDAYLDAILNASMRGGDREFKKAIEGSLVGKQLSSRYCETFEHLIEECAACDDEDRMRRVFERAALGQVYRTLCKATGRKPT